MIMLGVEVDLSGELGILDVPVWLKTSNAVFVTIFVCLGWYRCDGTVEKKDSVARLELIMRFLAVGWGGFWCGEAREVSCLKSQLSGFFLQSTVSF